MLYKDVATWKGTLIVCFTKEIQSCRKTFKCFIVYHAQLEMAYHGGSGGGKGRVEMIFCLIPIHIAASYKWLSTLLALTW